MPVEFKLDMEKVIATTLFLAGKNLPELTEGKLLKLMFLADKYHLVRYGRPITGDRYEAMNHGPVPSWTYALFNKQILKKPFTPEGKTLAAMLDIDTSGKYPI